MDVRTRVEPAAGAPAPTRLTVLAPDRTRLATWVHEPLVDAGAGRPGRTADGDAPPTGAAVPTLVLAHGWTLNHDVWDPVVTGLRQRVPVRVVTYDQRGHGASSHGRSRADVHALGDDLAAVLDAVAPQGPLVLGGHSMGGMTVMAFAGEHTDLLRDRVRGVCLVSTSAGELGPLRQHGLAGRTEVALMRLLARTPLLRPGRVITASGQRRLLFGESPDPAAVDATRAMVARTRVRTIGDYYAALSRHDELAALAGLAHVPVHVLVGERDRLTPVSHARRLAERIDGARLDVVPAAGHMLGFEATDLVVDHLVELVREAR